MNIILLSATNGFPLQLDVITDANQRATELLIHYGGKVKATFILATPFDVPDVLLNKTGETWSLKTLAEIRKEIQQEGQKLEDRWRDVVTKLSAIELQLDASLCFVGADIFPGAAGVKGHASFNLVACLSATEENQVRCAGYVAFSGNFSASIKGTAATLTLAWRIDFSAQSAGLSFAIPAFGVTVPQFAFPELDWSQINIANFTPAFQLSALPGIPVNITSEATCAITYSDAFGLNVDLAITGAKISALGSAPLDLGDFTLNFANEELTVTHSLTESLMLVTTEDYKASPLDGLTLLLHRGATLNLQLDVQNGHAEWAGCLSGNVSVFPTLNPDKRLTLTLALPFQQGQFRQQVNAGGQSWTREIHLQSTNETIESFNEYLPSVNSVAFSLRLSAQLLAAAGSLVDILSTVLAGLVRGVNGIAQLLLPLLEKLTALVDAASQKLEKAEILLVLDATEGHLQQLVVQLRHATPAGDFAIEANGFELNGPKSGDLALFVDLRDGASAAYIVLTPRTPGNPVELLTLGSDLWFASADTVRQTGDATLGDKPPTRLLMVNVKAKNNSRISLVPFGLRSGQATFMQALDRPLPVLDNANFAWNGFSLVPLEDLAEVTLKLPTKDELDKRLLPFLAVPANAVNETNSALKPALKPALKQYVEIVDIGAGNIIGLSDGKFKIPLEIAIHLLKSTVHSTVLLSLDARSMTSSLEGGLIHLDLPDTFTLLGMAVTFQDKDSGAPMHEKQMVLDLRTHDPRLYFADNVRATLAFTSLQPGRNEKPLTFICSEFVVHSGGLNLTAALDARTTIRLQGLETNFTFDKATLQVNNGRIETFRLRANGKLPPKLLGDVDAELELDFGDRGQGLDMLDGRLKLATESVRCEQTHFEFRLESMWLHAFRQDDRLCFCAFLTGAAFFKPTVTELADGMFSPLANVEIRFTDCPISGDSDAVRRELARLNTSYVVALDQPVQSSLFDTFFFEIRSIGFEPQCHMFDDLPFALVIGGQIRFAEQGDVVRAECDFHKLYIAGGTEGLLPRIRCEGLGLSLCLGSALKIEGKVVAVDGRMPASVLVSHKPEVDIQANGFLGQGRVAIPGLPPFAASFGFVEIRAKENQEVRRAWFVYLEAQRISYYFPLGPVPFYLREAGLGLGYHFTYVGIKEIDAAPNLPAVIKVLDKIAKSALEPAKLTTWEIAEEGDLTLVARAMFSMSSANPPQDHFTWNKEEEEKLPNLLLMNAVLAMRKSTFMMTANAWLGYSYFDWDKNRNIGDNSLAGKQTLIGYVVLAGERNEFLARLVSNPGAEIGPRLSLPPQFKESLKNIQYDATLYMRPGLLHFELGWPNHIRWKTTIAGVNIAVAGGAIFRVHDSALLVGMNLEGQLSFDLSGSLNAGVVGISVSASVSAALLARIMGYLDPLNAASSLFYSLFSLQVRVEFCVSAWLEIKAAFFKVTLRASLSVSLQIDVVAELALQGDAQMGSRMRASIAVSVFGRTLGLSVGLSLSPGIVDRAAARVGRFMDLGLVQDTPSSVAAIDKQDADNQKAAELGEARGKARSEAEKSSVPLQPAKTWGAELDPINKTQFNAILSWPKVSPVDEIEDIQNWVYITFLPAESFDAGTSSFYCTPRPDNSQLKDHKISLSGLPAAWQTKKIYLYTDKAWTVFTPGPSFEKETSINWLARQPMETETGENHFATLEEMVGAAFLGNSSGYREPTVRSQPERKTQTASLQEQYHGQELGYLGAITQDLADRRCHEARDYLLHKFAADLFDLTSTGSIPEDDVHVAHMGLTLLVPLDAADDEAMAAFEKIQMTIGKRIDGATTAYADSTRCQFFNPPRLRYATAPPVMVNTGIKVEGKTVKLAWALQWASEIEARAEDYLRHHRIVRTLTVGNSEYVSEPMIVISALQEVCEKDVSGTNIRYHTASNTRFTDDFADLPVAVKNVMFSPNSGAVVRYAVTPVCQSDTDGLVCTDFVSVISGEYRLPRLKKAEATLTLNPNESKIAGTYSLDIDLLADVDPTVRQQNPPKGMSLWWRIVARSEAILPSGQYGSDAQSRRSLVSSLGAGQDARPGDDIFFVWQDPEQEWRFLRSENQVKPDGLDGLDSLIRDLYNPRAWTLYAQLVLRKDDNVVFAGPLAALKHAVKIMPAAQVFPVSALEYVRKPFASDSAVMQPVVAEDLFIESGRAALPEPMLDPDHITLNLHPEFGAVSSLSWNIRPSGKTVNSKRFRLRSGFTVWSVTLDNGPVSWKTAKRHSEVRLLDEARVRVTPGEIGEPANWKMRYPSQAWQRTNGNAPWASQDNALISWPTFPIRKHLLPEPSSELIRALLSHGKPDFIELKMVHPDSIIQQTKWTFSIQNDKRIELAEGKIALAGMTTAMLRDTLRELTAEPVGTDSSQWSCEQRSGWILELYPQNTSVSVQPEPERIAMDFGRDLHPALEYLLTQMRRPEGKGALFELDRRPVPVVNAEQLGTFLSATGDAADPYGWAALDRLGLGVTVRLFDSNENQFLDPEYLYKQVKQGLDATKQAYPEFARNLCVERLLQPGTMTQCVPFTLRADRTGTFSHEDTDATLLPPSLVMVRLSVRPAISSSVGPWQPAQEPWRVFWVAFRNAFRLPLVDKKEPPTDLQNEDFGNYGEQWAKWNTRYFTYSILNNHSGDLFALGALEQTQPVRVAADRCGRISITLPEADGWAHQRAYAVVPQWRYAEMLGMTSDEAPSLDDIRIPDNIRNIAIIERTAPVIPQTVYALERIGDTQWGLKDGLLVKRETGDNLIPVGRIPGKDMAFVLPLHPEQILNEDNVPLKRTLSRTGLLWQLGLHTVDPEWCGEYQHMSARTDITSSELREGELLAMLNAKVAEGHTFSRSKIRLVTDLPHWYRHTVHAAASAGLSVSPASAVCLPEAYASLVTVDDDGQAVLTPNHPWEKLLSTMPQVTPEEGPLKMARYRVSWPLLRYHDTTDEITASLWDDPLSELPDPQVCYDLELRTAASGLHPQSTVRPLARIFRAPDSRPDKRRFQLLLQNRLWEMNCEIVGKDLEVLLSPLSEPIILTDSLQSALEVRDSLYRVPGGWSIDRLEEIVQKFTDNDSPLALMVELWKALAEANRGLPEAPELKHFQKYELRTLTITRPATDAEWLSLKQRIEEWLGRLAANSGRLGEQLSGALCKQLVSLCKSKSLRGTEYITVPWISGFPLPNGPETLERVPGSPSRHLVPELMTQTQYEAAMRTTDSDGKARLTALKQAQQNRVWGGGELIIRATRGDAIPLELAPVKPL